MPPFQPRKSAASHAKSVSPAPVTSVAASNATRPSRKLRSMKVSESFRTYVLDQLARVRDVKPRAMFGGVGLYSGEVFFGIIASDVLYLKVDDTNRADYEQQGAKAFTPFDDRPMTMPYYDVPASVLEDRGTLVTWAKKSIAVAEKAPARKR